MADGGGGASNVTNSNNAEDKWLRKNFEYITWFIWFKFIWANSWLFVWIAI